MGGPEPLSQREVVRMFERSMNTTWRLQFVPEETLEEQHRSSDALQKTFGALMLGYAHGDVIPGAPALATEYGVDLRSVTAYASAFRTRGANV
jgi:hypothetical protein